MRNATILLAIIAAKTCFAQTAPNVDPSWQVAFERDSNIWISNADGSHQRLLVKSATSPKWSPDGQRLAFDRKGWVWIKNMKEGKESKAFFLKQNTTDDFPFEDKVYIEWDPSEPVILAATSQSKSMTAYFPRAETDNRVQHMLKGKVDGYVTAPAWSQTGTWLSFAKNGDVWIAHRDTSNRGPFDNDAAGYYDVAYRLAPLAVFSDAELGASLTTPDWVDELAWMGDRRIVFHFQRQGGSGESEIGYLDIKEEKQDPAKSVDWSTWSGFTYKTHWILEGVFSPRICPDGKTLSFVNIDDLSLRVSDWNGKHVRTLFKDVENPDWRPVTPPRNE